MKIVKADAKGRVTGFEPGQKYLVTEETKPQWSKEHPDQVFGDRVGQVVGLVVGEGTTMWGVLKLLQTKESNIIFILDGKDYGYGTEDYRGSLVTHVWLKE